MFCQELRLVRLSGRANLMSGQITSRVNRILVIHLYPLYPGHSGWRGRRRAPIFPSPRQEFLDMVETFAGVGRRVWCEGGAAGAPTGRVRVRSRPQRTRRTHEGAGQTAAAGGQGRSGAVFCPFTAGCLSSSPSVDIPRPRAAGGGGREPPVGFPGPRPAPVQRALNANGSSPDNHNRLMTIPGRTQSARQLLPHDHP